MPIVELQCNACANRFEELILSSDSSELTCPKCGSQSLTRFMSAFAVSTGGTSPAQASCSRSGCGSGFS